LKNLSDLFQKAFYLFLREALWYSILPLVSESVHVFQGLVKLKVYANLSCFKKWSESFSSELHLATPTVFPCLRTIDVCYPKWGRMLDWGEFPGSPSLETISINGMVKGLELITEKLYPKLLSISLWSSFHDNLETLPRHISVRNLTIGLGRYTLEAFSQSRFPCLCSVTLISCNSEDFPQNEKIEKLTIEGSTNFSWVGRLAKLRELRIRTSRLFIHALPTLLNIRHLSIHCDKISGIGLLRQTRFPLLKKLTLGIEKKGFSFALAGHPELEYLEVYGLEKLYGITKRRFPMLIKYELNGEVLFINPS